MKYSEIITKVRDMYPNEYSDVEMMAWIGEVNADIKRNIEKNPSTSKYSSGEENSLIPPPYEDMYIYYILAKIAYYQRDFEAYSIHIENYSNRRNGYMAYYIRTYGCDTARFKNWF